ncbi:MAG: SprT family zinc-dependent metalloprotease [Anaerolineales bacterium]|nr:SprT family zinc-dependent metalloprotease [Anaerolineales bacterium]
MTGKIHFGKVSFSYDILHVPRTTMEIAVHPNKMVMVKAPLGSSQEEIEGRLRKRARWVLRQIEYFQQFEPRTTARRYVSGETHLYLGRQYRLKIIKSDANQIKLKRGWILIEVEEDKSPDLVKAQLELWYRSKAWEHFLTSLERCMHDFARMGYNTPGLQVRKMRTRWGSLSRNGKLTLNLSLVQAPRECIEYVITHELCHLKYGDHRPAFYKLLEKFMPDWGKRKRKLELALV